jgi:hypothetical protein
LIPAIVKQKKNLRALSLLLDSQITYRTGIIMGWLTSPQRIFLPDKIRIVFLIIAICAFWMTELGRFVYRPYVRLNGIQDFGLADSIGNLGGIIVQIFVVCAVVNPEKIQS